MKKTLAIILALAMILSLNLVGLSASAETVKYIYNDFNSGLSEAPLPTGNGDNTAFVMAVDKATYSCADGVLNVNLTNSNYLRIQNSVENLSDYKYMVVRMKGTNSWGAGLTGNSIAFWFGSYGTPGAKLYVPAEQLTADYSEVVFEMPAGYFDSIGADYKACMFITTERGAQFDIYIDEIYFRNDIVEEEPEDTNAKAYFHNFESGLSTEATATGYGDNTAYIFGVDGATYSCANGVLNVNLTNGNYLRIQNSMTDIADFDKMIVRMKGTSDWGAGLTGNSIAFWFGSYGTPGAKLYVPAEQLTAEYTDVEITFPEGYFDSIGEGYKACMFITTERGAKFDIYIDEIYFVKNVVEEKKAYFNDFESGLSTEATATGYGDNTAYVLGVDGATYSCANGVLNVNLTNGNYLRIQNSMTDIADFDKMIVRMKGTSDWGAGLTGNSIAFWFGSYGTPGAKLYVPAEQLTADYTDVEITFPEGYFDSIGEGYKACMFITTERGAKFDIYIDEIYFEKNAEPEYTEGDVNLNGDVDVLDLIRLKKIVAGAGDNTVASDVNGDGKTDIDDIVALCKKLLGAQ